MNKAETLYSFYECPFGYWKIGYKNGEIVFLKAVQSIDTENQPCPLTDAVNAQLCEYLDGRRKSFDFPYRFKGTQFQIKVWQALCEIPYGKTASYKDIAVKIGSPNACRAVGSANRRNPIWVAVPCHRVIAKSGKLSGYEGGTEMKKALLEIEKNVLFLDGECTLG